MSPRVLAVGIALGLSGCFPLAADTVEPPPEVPEGVDHVEATDDTLRRGEVELGLGLVGSGSSIERRRRVTFSGGDLSGTVREGSGDPLAGGSLVERGPWGELAAGKLSPRWDRGLLLGSPGNPWERSALDPRSRRGRSGEGAEVRFRQGAGLLLGRFAGRPLAGARLTRGSLSSGLLVARGGDFQSGVGLARDREAVELALDRTGRWRAEGVWIRGSEGASLTTAVRHGSSGFRSLAEPKRGGPARSATFGLSSRALGGTLRSIVSVWRFRPSRSGARAAIELERPLSERRTLVVGFEEQQGYRGELRSAPGVRQGGWIEWSRAAEPIGLLVRHEAWGGRPGLRDVARLVSSCRIEAALPKGARVSLAHTVFRVRRGESLYLREAESDRMVLRALSGEGQRTQLDIRFPIAHGALRASGQIASLAASGSTPRWRLEWTRRSRPSAARSPARGDSENDP